MTDDSRERDRRGIVASNACSYRSYTEINDRLQMRSEKINIPEPLSRTIAFNSSSIFIADVSLVRMVVWLILSERH